MDYRKLIKFGNSSHILSMPNDWLKKNKLKKGDLIYVSENENDELILSPQLKEYENEGEISILDSGDIEEIYRRLVSNYIAGYNIINIKLNNLESFSIVKNYINSLIGFEIIEQNGSHLKIKDLIDIKEISMEKIIRRIDTIIRSMIEDTKMSYKKNNYESIYSRDSEINRLTFFSHRLIKKCSYYPKLAQVIGIEYKKLIEEWMMITSLEKIGDEIKRISRFLTKLKDNRSQNIKEVISLFNESCNDYVKCINAYYKKDINTAYEIAKKKDIIIKKCNLLAEKNSNHYIFNTLDKIKTLETHIRDVGRSIYQVRI